MYVGLILEVCGEIVLLLRKKMDRNLKKWRGSRSLGWIKLNTVVRCRVGSVFKKIERKDNK
jgi:hypothetical protein